MGRLLVLLAMAAPMVHGAGLGDAVQGWRWMQELGCPACHGLPSSNGKKLPNLTPYGLAGALWNHAPSTWQKPGAAKILVSEAQAEDILAWFFAAGLLDEPADARKGKALLVQKGCAACHVAGTATPVKKWNATATHFLSGVWNHGGVMRAAMERRLIRWPSMATQEMRDLLAFVRTETGSPASLARGSVDAGLQKLTTKGCSGCHQGELRLDGTGVRHDFASLASSFWNHAPMMMERPAPLGETDIADVLGWLWSARYFEKPGNATRGRDLFTRRACDRCHAGPPPVQSLGSAAMIAAVWKHASEGVASANGKGVPWPAMSGDDMRDVAEYWATSSRKEAGAK